MRELMNSINNSYNFERYDENDRGIKSVDNTYKLIIERENKKYFIRFNSVKAELTKNEFIELQNKWEIGRTNALVQELSKKQTTDLALLNEIYGKLGTNS